MTEFRCSNDIFLDGAAGADVLYGGAGNDILQYRYAEDSGVQNVFFGDAGEDALEVYLTAQEFANTTTLLSLYSMNNFIQQNRLNAAFDGMQFVSSLIAATVAGIETIRVYNNGAYISDFFTGNYVAGQLLTGSAAGDTLAGTVGDDVIQGLSGNDTLHGLSGADTLYGDAGNDHLYGEQGNDTLNGGLGDDVLEGEDGHDSMSGNEGADQINSGSGDDTAQGGDGDDDIHGEDGHDILKGDAGNDALVGGLGNDALEGGAGNDTLNGGGGDDSYIIGAGTDVIEDGAGNDTLFFTAPGYELFRFAFAQAGNDLRMTHADGSNTKIVDFFTGGAVENVQMNAAYNLNLNTFNTWIRQTAANTNYQASTSANIIIGDQTNATISGNGGNDILYGGTGTDILYGGQNDDILIADAAGGDTLHGEYHNDIIYGSQNNWLYGDDGNDLIVLFSVNENMINGNAGIDTVSFENIAVDNIFKIDLQGERIHLDNGTLKNIGNTENVIGTRFDDLIVGTAANNDLKGGAGIDAVSYASAGSGVTFNLSVTTAQNTVGAGTNTVSGFENITGSNYNDTLTGDSGDNAIDGGTGNDAVQGGAGNDTLIGGAGTDAAIYASASAGVTVNLSVTTAQNTIGAGTDTVSGFENLTGSAFDDILTGDANVNIIDGGAGNDTIQGGAGNDTLIGGTGTDRLTYAAATAAVTVNLATLTAQNTVAAGTDTISGFENLTGSAFNDTLTGNTGNNVIEGGAGNDTINGSTGTDTLSYTGAASGVTVNLALTTAQNTISAGTDTVSNFENLTGSVFDDVLTGNTGVNIIDGGAGNDIINGGSGNDTIRGGLGNDTLIGGAGIDTLYGEGDADIFLFEVATAFSAQDTVADFSIAQGDKINIASLLVGYNPTQSAIDNFVNFTAAGANSTLAVDRDGTGTSYAMQTVATLTGVTGLDETQLLANGKLIVV